MLDPERRNIQQKSNKGSLKRSLQNYLVKRLKALSMASLSLHITKGTGQGFYLHFSHAVLFWMPTHTATQIYSTVIQ